MQEACGHRQRDARGDAVRHVPAGADLMAEWMAQPEADVPGAQQAPDRFPRRMLAGEPVLQRIRVAGSGQVHRQIGNGAEPECFQERVTGWPPEPLDCMVERLDARREPEFRGCRARKLRIVEDHPRLCHRIDRSMLHPCCLVGHAGGVGELPRRERGRDDDLVRRGMARIDRVPDHHLGGVDRAATAKYDQSVRPSVLRLRDAGVNRARRHMLTAFGEGASVRRAERSLDLRGEVRLRRQCLPGQHQRPLDTQMRDDAGSSLSAPMPLTTRSGPHSVKSWIILSSPKASNLTGKRIIAPSMHARTRLRCPVGAREHSEPSVRQKTVVQRGGKV